MNRQSKDILNNIIDKPYVSQRILSEECGHSLGVVNRSLKELLEEGYITENIRPTSKAMELVAESSPKNAIILAAGIGMRMVPINTLVSKGLLVAKGECLVERLIKQLHEVGIKDIYVVVGFMKEQYEYLIDEYDVKLVVNTDYATRNNLHSLEKVVEKLGNSYIVPCDMYCHSNPFRKNELYSWYMVGEDDIESSVRVNRKLELVKIEDNEAGNRMIGISYVTEKTAEELRDNIKRLCGNPDYDDSFWEEAAFARGKMLLFARPVKTGEVVEINTFEQLRELDSDSLNLKSDAIAVITEALKAAATDIKDIQVLKKGMTNRSFLFECKGKRYIMRIPGEGTDRMIDRAKEAAVYKAIDGLGICDNIIYMNPENGYKITEYIENARVCNPSDKSDITACMKRLRNMHEQKLAVEHEFNIFEQINFYESLWQTKSCYRDYENTKKNVWRLIPYIEAHAKEKVLSHIDAVPDNFLMYKDASGNESIRLIDWEYAGMQDPHVDIAMFCIYALYDKEQVDALIDAYFTEGCSKATRTKIYCYISVCGLLWSNWCEYKRSLGVEFGEYSLRQYRYAKDYFRLVEPEL